MRHGAHAGETTTGVSGTFSDEAIRPAILRVALHRVSPVWPAWPPLFLPDRPRRLLGTRGGFLRPSLEGGLLLFELFFSSWRRRSATCCRSAAFSWHKAVFCSRRTSIVCRSVSISALRAGASSISVLTHGAASSASPNLRPSNDFRSLAALATQRNRREGVLGSYDKRLYAFVCE
jgi:hypothetical protein